VQEPVLANLSGYSVLIRTPEGNHIHLRAGAGVAGPGFEQYIDNKTLNRVAPTFAGPIVYETPVKAPVPEILVPVPAKVEVEEEVSALYEELIGQPGTPASEPEPKPPSYDLKYGGNNITVPSNASLQTMSKSELIFLATKLGMRTDGSRAQLASRIQPLAGKSVAAKK